MAKRYYVCDILGDGTDENPYRPAVSDLGVGYTAVIKSGEDGRPLEPWALVLVASRDHAILRNAPGIDPLPDFPLDGKVNAINAGTINALKQVLTRRGLPPGLVDGKDGYREVLRGIGQRLEPTFDENRFDIRDV